MAPPNASPLLVSSQASIGHPMNQPDSPLLRLPGELRNHIYAYAFDSASIRNRTGRNNPYTPSDWILSPDSIPLLFICRQIYREAHHFRDNFTSLEFSLELSSFLRMSKTAMLLGRTTCAQVCEFRLDTGLINFLVEQVARYGYSNWSFMKPVLKQVFPKLERIVAIDRVSKHKLEFLKRTIERGFGLKADGDCEMPKVIICEPCFGFECAKVPKLKLRTR